MKALAAALLITTAVSPALSQQAAPRTDAPPSVFDVVSIRPSKPGGQLSFGATPDGYRAQSTPLFWIIMQAYFPRSTAFWRTDRLQSAPTWVTKDEYDVEAKVDEKTANEFAHLTDAQRDQRLKPMLQAMLAERCHLRLRQVATKGSVYALVLSHHGPKFKPVSSEDRAKSGGIPIAGDGTMLPIPARDQTRHEFRFTHTSMTALAEVLSGLATSSDPTVEDLTKLSGTYDFVLYKREEDPTPTASQAGVPATPDPATLWDINALGLELKRAKATLPSLIIDHIVLPTPN